MPVGVALEIAMSCAKCQAALPLNGAADSVLCDRCQTPTQTPPELWQKLLGDAVGAAIAMAPNEGRSQTIFMGGAQVKLQFGRQDPRCPCKAPFDPDGFERGAGAGKLFCTTCGKPSSVRRAPGWMKSVHPASTFVVGETLAAPAARGAQAKDLRFHCYHCGAPLPIDGSSRSVSCTHCQASVMVPDDIWLRLHPARTVDRWYLVLSLDLAGAVAMLPADVDELCDVCTEPGGNVIVAYHDDRKGDAGHPARLGLLGPSGALAWLQDGVEFSDDARLFTSPLDGTCWLVDPDGDGFARAIDPRTGDPIRTLPSPPEDAPDTPLNVKRFDQFAIDWDGSFLVERDWSDTSRTALRRFAPDGRRVPLWPGMRLHADEDVSRPEWESLPRKHPVRLPSRALFGVGWDGAIHLVHEEGLFVAKYTRDGLLLGAMPLPQGFIHRVRDFTTARDGTVTLLAEHAQKIGDDHWLHLIKILPDGRFYVAMGPHAPDSPPMGRYTRRLKGAPDGTLILAHDVDDLRVIAPSGAIAWMTDATRRRDASVAEDLAEARRGKKQAADRGT